MKLPFKRLYRNEGRDKLLPRLSLLSFDHARIAAVVWLVLVAFGVLCYATLLRREGFPSINIPTTIINGAYLVNDPSKVDRDVALPLSRMLLQDNRVKSVEAQSRGATYNLIVQYKSDSVDTAAANRSFEQRIKDGRLLPKQATYDITSPKFGFTERGDDAVIAVYSSDGNVTAGALKAEANQLVDYLKSHQVQGVQSASVIDPFVTATNTATGASVASQTKFDRYGVRQNGETRFFPAVAVGLNQQKGNDVIKVDDKLRAAVGTYNARHGNDSFEAAVSASYAPDIKAQISELQRALLEGLVAVLVVGSLVIAIRASLITVLSMATVLSVTVGVLYLIGYTLNTITLFSLVLCLGLVVDDTIIMVEAIDAQRRRLRDSREIILTATGKVSRAMLAATLTAALSFAPLAFVGGVLGSFIRAIPVTVIASLLISLTVALVFIPLFARMLLLGGKQLGAQGNREPGARVEQKIADSITAPMRWARNSRRRLVGVGLVAVIIGLLFIGAGGALFQKVTFNIFPPSKDSNGLIVTIQNDPGTTVAQAEAIADRADTIIGRNLGDNLQAASYYETGTDQKATLIIRLTPYNQRGPHSPELRDQLQRQFVTFAGAKVKVTQQDVGPPPSAFSVRIKTDNRQQALDVARDMRTYLFDRQLTRASGTTARINEVTITDPGSYARTNGQAYVSITAGFDSTDTSTLVTLARKTVEDHYTASKLASFGLPGDVLDFNLGSEQQNQDSFKTLALAFPLLLLAIFVLLAVQFRSLLQPLLIFMAIPFSLFGITFGLYLTDNPFSFFAALGFFALIGLSLKNTILLTDYANRLRREGQPPVDAAVGALQERFRPLVATSLTAIVSLIPLAIASPFWEGLAVVLIFGLLSSTFLVLTVFPYYYLGAEFLRLRVRRGPFALFIALAVVLTSVVLLTKLPLYYVAVAVLLAAFVSGC